MLRRLRWAWVLRRILPLFCLLLLAPALESQNSSVSRRSTCGTEPRHPPATTISVDVKVVDLASDRPRQEGQDRARPDQRRF